MGGMAVACWIDAALIGGGGGVCWAMPAAGAWTAVTFVANPHVACGTDVHVMRSVVQKCGARIRV